MAEGEVGKDGKRNERTVVMDKSKGEPVISVKAKSKDRVSYPNADIYAPSIELSPQTFVVKMVTLQELLSCSKQSTKSRDRKSPSKEKDILSFDQIKEQRERERQRQRERDIREVERRRHSG